MLEPSAVKRLSAWEFMTIPLYVWDEIAGYFITMLAIPSSTTALLLGFGLFRWLDISKPWPIRWLDRHVSGGLGIMLDDVAAAIVANLILRAVIPVSW